MSVEPFAQDETTQVESVDGSPPSAAAEPERPAIPTTPGDTPEGLGSERIAAPFTSEIDRPVHGVAEALGTTGFDESETADPV